MTDVEKRELIAELRDEARAARNQTSPDPEGYGNICSLRADEDMLDRAANALEESLAGEWEYIVRSSYHGGETVIDTGPTDFETAKAIMGFDNCGGRVSREMLRRTPAGPWEEVSDA